VDLLVIFGSLLFIAASLAIVWRTRLSRAALALASVGIALGAVLGAIPGGAILIGATVVAATGPTSGTPWALFTGIALAGMLLGIGSGASAMYRLASRSPRSRSLLIAAACASLGGALGCVAAYAALALSSGPPIVVLLAAFAILSASLAGFASGLRGRTPA
jgi:hypothetical protein